MLISGISAIDAQPLIHLTRRLAESGVGIRDARVASFGNHVHVGCLVSGSWDQLAKLETALARMERDEGLKFSVVRANPRAPRADLLPYQVEVIAADRAGALFRMAEFFQSRGIAVDELRANRYQASHTGAEMFSADITIGVPAKSHIAALREDFLEFCDTENIDAILDPVKF